MVRRYRSLLYTSMTCHKRKTNNDVSVQTIIRVFPHILDEQATARVTSEKRTQTEIATKPDDKNEQFYSLLRFTPYQDIQENCIRIIDLPRPARLHFNPGVQYDKMAQTARYFSLADDDGVGYICSEIIHRLKWGKKVSYKDTACQTNLNVYPNLLANDNVATVKNNTSSQTIVTEDDDASTESDSV